MSLNRLMVHPNKPTNHSSSVTTEQPTVYHQTTQSEPLKFQTSQPLLTLYPINIALTPVILETVDTPSGKVSLALGTHHDITRRARIEETKKVDPSNITSTDDTTQLTTVQPTIESPRKKGSIPKQVTNPLNPTTPTKPATFADNAPNSPPKPTTPVNATANPPAKAPAVDPNPPPLNSRPILNPPSSTPASSTTPGKTTQPPSSVVAPLTPTPETGREGATRDKSAPQGALVGVKPPHENPTGAPPTSPVTPLVSPPVTNNTPQPEITPNNHTESAKVEAVPAGHATGSNSQLTSIAIGVASAGSLVIFVILVVIFKIRVSKKRARRQEKLGDDFFGSHDRLSFSDSADSRKSFFFVPRPIGKKMSLNTYPGPEKPLNHAGIGAHSPPTQSLADAPRNHTPTPLTLHSYPNVVPPRPPRSPLRTQAIQKPENFYRPPLHAGSENYIPDSQSDYSTNTGRGKAKAHEFYGQPTREHSYAMEYLDNYYPDSYESSAYNSNVDPLGGGGPQRNEPAEMIGMDFLQVEDRPYDHRYTVDRNGILNNFTSSIPPVPVPRESDYFYRKRVP